jgi:hypothetical protein
MRTIACSTTVKIELAVYDGLSDRAISRLFYATESLQCGKDFLNHPVCYFTTRTKEIKGDPNRALLPLPFELVKVIKVHTNRCVRYCDTVKATQAHLSTMGEMLSNDEAELIKTKRHSSAHTWS